MNRDDITKLAKEAGFGNYAYEAAGIFERFAALVAAAEREKCTGTQEFVTLPREVVKRAMDALYYTATKKSKHPNQWMEEDAAMKELRATLEQSQESPYGECDECGTEYSFDPTDGGSICVACLKERLEQPQNHVPDVGNMVQAGWKLVPVEQTAKMVDAARSQSSFPAGVWRAMLAAAPEPPAPEQPQANQPAMTPIAQRKLDSLLTEGYTISGYSVYHERKHQHGFVTGAGLVGWWKPEGVEYPQPLGEQEPVAWALYCADKLHLVGINRHPLDGYHSDWSFRPLYTRPHPRQPLTVEQIDAIADAMPGGLEGFMKGWGWRQFARAVIEATHNIK